MGHFVEVLHLEINLCFVSSVMENVLFRKYFRVNRKIALYSPNIIVNNGVDFGLKASVYKQ